MDERLRFVARLLDGEKMAPLCREFDISRKTGYKIFNRYKDIGLDGLTDRTRRPMRYANQLPFQIESKIVQLKKERLNWGAPKIRERLRKLHPDIPLPAISTVHAVLDRHGLVKRRGRRRYKAQGTSLSRPTTPNDLWCADYKGEFMLTDRRYCYPLTITDFASRYLITCEALSSTKETFAFNGFERAFRDFGMPRAIRTDNGVPFSSPMSLFNLPLQVREASIPVTKDYTISVDDIRIKLHDIGISKSKDTIQRYCREGSLDCQKLGMFKRYFATEKSIEKLIEKIQSDATASNSKQVHAGADTELEKDLQVHKGATEKDVPEYNDLYAGADDGTQVQDDVRTTKKEEVPEVNSHDGKIVEMLERQIDDKDKTISFLQEELVARRGAVSALEKIIDAFGDNAQASLLSAENEKQRMNQTQDKQQGSEPAEVVHDIHSNGNGANRSPDYGV